MSIKILALLALAATLGGCASTRLDADVHTIGGWPEGRVPGGFAFERLPSQAAHAAEQDQLEAAALPAIERAGFKPALDATPDVLVQVAERMLQAQGVYPDPFLGTFWMGNAIYGGGRWRGAAWGSGWGWGYGIGTTVPYYVVEVSVLILDARSKQALYEARARSDGSWLDERTRPALFVAALKDFPYTAVSPRRVTVDLSK
jgi:Domain of unknown function (DUF4136)